MMSFAMNGPYQHATGPAAVGSPGVRVPERTPCAVRTLRVTDFRNYTAARMALDSTPVVLTGDNGAGKTNLLEAVSYLVPGRGLRGARLGDVTRIGARAWAVAAGIATATGVTRVGTGLERRDGAAVTAEGDDGPGGERRVVHIDGTPAGGPAALGDVAVMSWLTPQMDRLFIEGAGGRRRFLDRLVLALHPAHGRQAAAYERAMRERTRLLIEGNRDRSWITALELRMAEHGVAVAAARRDALGRLQLALNMSDSVFPAADIDVEGSVEADLAALSALEAEDRFRIRLEAARARDAVAGRAGDGPHLSDLKARHRARAMPAELCSTGEQKTLLIGIVMAAARLALIETGVAPILLLDEVAAHLDTRRREALFGELLALGAQAWMTGTDAALFSQLEGQAQFFTISSGTIAA